MNEKDLNIEYICDKTLLNKDDELVPIILSLIQESYKAGLCQTEFDNTMNLIEENQELKKQLEDMTLCRDIASGHREEVQDREAILLNQQKKFIKYLEDEIQQQETIIAENQEKSYFLIYEDEKENLKLSSQKAYIRKIILEEILQKYKSIIGVSDEKEN